MNSEHSHSLTYIHTQLTYTHDKFPLRDLVTLKRAPTRTNEIDRRRQEDSETSRPLRRRMPASTTWRLHNTKHWLKPSQIHNKQVQGYSQDSRYRTKVNTIATFVFAPIISLAIRSSRCSLCVCVCHFAVSKDFLHHYNQSAPPLIDHFRSINYSLPL